MKLEVHTHMRFVLDDIVVIFLWFTALLHSSCSIHIVITHLYYYVLSREGERENSDIPVINRAAAAAAASCMHPYIHLLRTLITKIIWKCRSFWEARRLSLITANLFFHVLSLIFTRTNYDFKSLWNGVLLFFHFTHFIESFSFFLFLLYLL